VLIRYLQVSGFRNLQQVAFEPAPRFNVLHGDNGQGKTNLLESIYLVGTLRSFRTQHAQEMIGWDGKAARVSARVERNELERVYEISLEPRKRHVRLDGKTPRHLAEYFGDFNVVLFAPEDLRVPRGSPAGRRRFLDRSVFNRRSTFLADAQSYAKALRSRNVLLRDQAPREELLTVYEEQLALHGTRILSARRSYLAELSPLFREAYESITHAGVAAGLVYKGNDTLTPGDLLAARRKDLSRRQTTLGPHVDDVEFLLDEKPARAFASQGQLRALVLAWKTAEMRLLREVHGDTPVLLLDDVSSELDPARNQYLFAFLQEIDCQCFITTTHPRHVLIQENRQDFQVVAGQVTARKSLSLTHDAW
jgi:DNA replication and repair protein RecF